MDVSRAVTPGDCWVYGGRSMTDGFRVVVGNEPRFYREALAAALRLLRPDLEIILTEPADLDEEFGRGGAHLVVCSHLGPTVQDQALAWILLYPDAENRAEVCIAGHERSVAGIEITDLLAIINEVERLVRAQS